jgi:hypothetical protein
MEAWYAGVWWGPELVYTLGLGRNRVGDFDDEDFWYAVVEETGDNEGFI